MMVAIHLRSPEARAVPRRAAASGRAERRTIRAAQEGSGEAFEELFRRYWSRAHRAAYLIVHDASAAEDIARRPSLPPSARSTASIAGDRSGRGFTASS